MPSKGSPTDYLRRVLKPGDTVVDVGAHMGEYTEQFAEMVGPTGTVWAIEADARTYPDLDQRATVLPQLTVVKAAAGDRAGMTTFHRCEPRPSNSSRFKGAILTATLPPILVPMLPLDAIVDHADAVKVDVQGGEIDVLKGAQHLRWHCPVWIVEVWPFGLGHAQKPVKEMLALMGAAGLKPHWMGDGQAPQLATETDILNWALACQQSDFVNLVFKA